MKKSYFGNPDPFALLPMLSLLPVQGDLSKLSNLKESMYARFERVLAFKKGSGTGEGTRVMAGELAMLKQVLEFLEVVPEDDSASFFKKGEQ